MSACTDDNTVENQTQGDRGATVNFNVSSAQDEMLLQQQMAPITRSAVLSHLGDEGLNLEDLATHRHAVQGATDLCMIETTIEGVNPVLPSADTRARVKTNIDGTFTSLGYRSTTPGFLPDKPDWFYNAPTNANGTLVTPLQWAWTHRYGRFYAVYPEAKSENKITLSPATHSGTPYVNFEVEPDVKTQKDLMTACSGEGKYETRGIAPTTNLKFKHALTAVRFAVGQNLSWNKRITKVEIKNVCSKGKYMLPTQYGGAGTWVAGSLTDRKDFVLDVATSPIDLKQNPNTVIMGNPSDNYTFYMIPQDLTGVEVVVTLEDNDPAHPSPAPNTITIPLTGKSQWKPGTSKLYKLSQNTSDWTYSLTVTKQPAAAAYNQSTSDTYGITSMRTAPDGTQQAAAWKVKEYSFDNGATWVKTIPANSWFKGLSLKEGGSNPNIVGEERGRATLKTDGALVDLLDKRNKALKDATPKGSAGNPYNLANPGGNGARNHIEETANSYVISAPGHYAIPLVYGNGIKQNQYNRSAYHTDNTGSFILQDFKDHLDRPINSPLINVQNSTDKVMQTAIVWADEPHLVRPSSFDWHSYPATITNESGVTVASSVDFVEFEVTKNDIRSGNAVIAVKNEYGITMWSWHLWFAPESALNTIACTNYQGHVYKFTEETLGMKYTNWGVTNYTTPRSVRVRVAQMGKPNNVGEFTITQNPSSVRQGITTLYQWGRKDAMPGTDAIADGSFTQNAGDHMSIPNGIQHPENFYIWGTSWYNGYNQYNLWSMDNTTTGHNDNAVVKTIYDPCPVGLKMPASNAFTSFTTTGQSTNNSSEFNVAGSWNFGYTFKSKSGTNTNTVFFPASGYRISINGLLNGVGSIGLYWSAIPRNIHNGHDLFSRSDYVNPLNDYVRSFGFAVRPVAE